MPTDTFTSLEHIRLEAHRQLENAGVETKFVQVLKVFSKDRGHELVLTAQNDKRIAYVTMCDRMHDLTPANFSAMCIQPAVVAIKAELEKQD